MLSKHFQLHAGTFSWILEKPGDPHHCVAGRSACFLITKGGRPHKAFVPDDNGKSIDIPDQLIQLNSNEPIPIPNLPTGKIAETIEVPGTIPSELPDIETEPVTNHIADKQYRTMLLEYLAHTIQNVEDYGAALSGKENTPSTEGDFWTTEAAKTLKRANGSIANLKAFISIH